MQKRTIILGDYDTAAHGWTLTGWELSPAKYRQNFVEVPGMDGPLDLSTVLGGRPVYDTRTLTATLECSEGTRLEREALIDDMVNRLTGQRMAIVLPDDPLHYITGRVEVAKDYNDPAHAAVTVTAICGPWREAMEETVEFVPLCGKNLFNNADPVVGFSYRGSVATIDTGLRSSGTMLSQYAYCVLRVLPVDMLVGKNVTLSTTIQASGRNKPQAVLGYLSPDGEGRKVRHYLYETGSVTLTVEEEYRGWSVAVWLYANGGTAMTELVEGYYTDFTNLQVEIGNAATGFEPYGVESPKEATLVNDQRRTVCPTAIVQNDGRTVVLLEYDGSSAALSTGVYKLPGLQLGTGEQTVNVSGTGAVAFTYRKAVL